MIEIVRTTSNEESYHCYYDSKYIGDITKSKEKKISFRFGYDTVDDWDSKFFKSLFKKLEELDKK